jgi:Peptidase family M1 domain
VLLRCICARSAGASTSSTRRTCLPRWACVLLHVHSCICPTLHRLCGYNVVLCIQRSVHMYAYVCIYDDSISICRASFAIACAPSHGRCDSRWTPLRHRSQPCTLAVSLSASCSTSLLGCACSQPATATGPNHEHLRGGLACLQLSSNAVRAARHRDRADPRTHAGVAAAMFRAGTLSLCTHHCRCARAQPDTATDLDYERVEGVIGHEYFHNWTGNRVTCRDWFQLTLKEVCACCWYKHIHICT